MNLNIWIDTELTRQRWPHFILVSVFCIVFTLIHKIILKPIIFLLVNSHDNSYWVVLFERAIVQC